MEDRETREAKCSQEDRGRREGKWKQSILQKETEGTVAAAAAKAPHLSPRENCREESGSLTASRNWERIDLKVS